VLVFASPFFEAALSGNWSETGRPLSMSSVITISQPPSIPGDKSINEVPTEMTFAPIDPDIDPDDADFVLDVTVIKGEAESARSSETETDGGDVDGVNDEERAKARSDSLAKLQSGSGKPSNSAKASEKSKLKATIDADGKLSPRKVSPAQAKVKRSGKSSGTEAVIVLKEEKVRGRMSLLFLQLIKYSRRAHSTTFSDSYTLSK
jgi:hypothetical protein